MISSAISADLGRQDALRGSQKALATVTGIVDGTGSIGAAAGQVSKKYYRIKLFALQTSALNHQEMTRCNNSCSMLFYHVVKPHLPCCFSPYQKRANIFKVI